MKILIDENMPYAEALFADFGQVVKKSGRGMHADDLIDVDALFCRSVTKVDQALLSKANKLKFVGTATAGIDHIDTKLLAQRNIFFTSAAGCNKVGVAEYVLSVLMTLAIQHNFSLYSKKVGIVGAGMVGTYLAKCLDALNISYQLCDPIKEKQGDGRAFFSLDTLLTNCDVITLHTPLTYEGDDATYHLIDEKELAVLRPNTILINAARGAVVNNQALKTALKNKKLIAVLDVFEHEPLVDLELLNLLSFATPHIAGYGLEGKARGTTMVYNAFIDFLHLDKPKASIDALLPSAPFSKIELGQVWKEEYLMPLCQLVYDVRRDDADFRKVMTNPSTQSVNFDLLRKNYWDRREYSAITLVTSAKYKVESLAELGFKVKVVA